MSVHRLQTLSCVYFCFRICAFDCLDDDLVKGKIVVCDHHYGFIEAERAGVLGTILANSSRGISTTLAKSLGYILAGSSSPEATTTRKFWLFDSERIYRVKMVAPLPHRVVIGEAGLPRIQQPRICSRCYI